MNRRLSSLPLARWLVGGLAVGLSLSCGPNPPPDPDRYLPDPKLAREALEKSLQAWRASPGIERTVTTIRPIMFVEQQQPAGQRLRTFEILGETAGYEGYRRLLAKLDLEDPDESTTVAYYVFGQGPIWVYRAEDFDMIMHMDKTMMPAPPPAPAAPGAGKPSIDDAQP
ncbi:hypothetical protein [Paludisphaera borealis]|uniref:Lipoprotein n=1 Tax=Paludisphaera borealis TaxID=1387353 RepID=A0A1U7CXR4_9BACT|nr:hypothetical protein [Paludisphaera borealis]APW63742.1 hypothetical protein BSF38_05318 [Paludisphaera borealis]